MAKITRNPLPAPIRPEDLGGKETQACRVKDVLVDVAVDRAQNRRGKTTVMILWEHEGKGLYLNESSKEHAVVAFGSDETDDWKDKPVAIRVVRSTFTDRESQRETTTKKVWIAAPEEWPDILGKEGMKQVKPAAPKGTK